MQSPKRRDGELRHFTNALNVRSKYSNGELDKVRQRPCGLCSLSFLTAVIKCSGAFKEVLT